MYKTNTSNIKNKQSNVEQYYNLKRNFRHSAHKKTKTISRGFSTTYVQDPKQTGDQSNPLFSYPHNYTLDMRNQKTNSQSVELRNKKTECAVQKVYSQKKNAYKNYIREIYQKINEELRKKNTFLSIQSHNLKQIDYSKVLIAREFKPVGRSADLEEENIKNKLKQKLKLQKLQQQSASLEKVKNKLFVIKKANEKHQSKLKNQLQNSQRQFKCSSSHQKQKIKQKPLFSIIQTQISCKQQKTVFQKSKEKVFALIVPKSSNKVNIDDFIPAKKMLNKKDPFVCGLNNDKQSNQQKNKQKIIIYIDFLWRMSYSMGLFAKSTPEEVNYKAFVGPGNNSIMIKSIIRRRYWWVIADKAQDCNLVWTQLKQNSIFKQLQEQSSTKKENLYPFNVNLFFSHLQQNFPFEENSQYPNFSLFNAVDNALWQQHISKNTKTQLLINERTFTKRANFLNKKNVKIIQDSKKLIMHNHLQHNYFIGNKKALFYYMKRFYQLNEMSVFDALPLTFHIIKGTEDPQYKRFITHYNKFQSIKKATDDQKNIWILKPGEYSNRGNGITVCHSLDDILVRLKSKEKSSDGNLRTFILQKYIEKPLLYKSRKFDIRHYLLISCLNGVFRAYWYPQGYIRTSSAQFTLKRGSNLFVHLTNDAIQKNSEEYGKYEKGNKISYQKFQQYLNKNVRSKSQKNVFFRSILPQMKQMTINAVKATYLNLDEKKKEHNFQLLGMDFMIDQNYKPWLIEINTNPCLELSCPLLAKLIPSVVQNTFKICVDPFFPPPEEWPTNKKNFLADNTLEQNKFELIFDETIEGQTVEKLYRGEFKVTGNIGKIEQDAQIYQNDGLEQWEGESLKKEE